MAAKRLPAVLGFTPRLCPTCGDIQRCAVFECGPHWEARCGKCNAYAGFVGKKTQLEPDFSQCKEAVENFQAKAKEFTEVFIGHSLAETEAAIRSKPVDLACLPSRNQIALDFATRTLALIYAPVEAKPRMDTVENAIDAGFKFADCFLERCG